jgi:hypothetical protein
MFLQRITFAKGRVIADCQLPLSIADCQLPIADWTVASTLAL